MISAHFTDVESWDQRSETIILPIPSITLGGTCKVSNFACWDFWVPNYFSIYLLFLFFNLSNLSAYLSVCWAMCLFINIPDYGFAKAIISRWVWEVIREKSRISSNYLQGYLLEDSNEIWRLFKIWQPSPCALCFFIFMSSLSCFTERMDLRQLLCD